MPPSGFGFGFLPSTLRQECYYGRPFFTNVSLVGFQFTFHKTFHRHPIGAALSLAVKKLCVGSA